MLLQGIMAEPWIIDPHTHFKGEEQIRLEARDKKRHPKDTLGWVVTPADYKKLAAELDIEATLVVEAVAQDHPEFNDWLLSCANAEVVCGYVARGDLARDDFLVHHTRYKNTGYLNGYRFRREEAAGYLEDETARKHLAQLEKEEMVIDLLIDHGHAKDALRLARAYPKLKIIINHCLRARIVDGGVSPEWMQAVEELGKQANIFMKISSILNFAGTQPFLESAPTELSFYLPALDPCFEAFGEDRVIFATNWGVCSHYGKTADVVRIVREFLRSKSVTAERKGMRENAIRIYGISKINLP